MLQTIVKPVVTKLIGFEFFFIAEQLCAISFSKDEEKSNQLLHNEYQKVFETLASDIALHSKCQPGLPLPQGDDQPGSSALLGS